MVVVSSCREMLCHQGGEFFRRHPAGNQFVEYFGEMLFRSDLCNADVAMGDLLIHDCLLYTSRCV